MSYILQISDFLNDSIKEKMSAIDKKIEKRNKLRSARVFFPLCLAITSLIFGITLFTSSLYEKVESYDLYFFSVLVFLFVVLAIPVFLIVATFAFAHIKTNYLLHYKNTHSELWYNDEKFFPLNALNTDFNIIIDDKNKHTPDVIKIVENAYARGGFYNYEIVLLKNIKTIEENINKEQVLVI